MNDWLDKARARLSSSRFTHVQGVVDTALVLAARYRVDQEKAFIAAALHDIFREKTAAELTELAGEVGAPLPEEEAATWHGPVAAARLALDFQIHDAEIAGAIAWHTIGHPEMGPLAQVLFVADAIEPGRGYDGVEKLRLAASIDLSLAVAATADASIEYLLERQLPIAMKTVTLRNKMWRLVDERLRKDYNQSRKSIEGG